MRSMTWTVGVGVRVGSFFMVLRYSI